MRPSSVRRSFSQRSAQPSGTGQGCSGPLSNQGSRQVAQVKAPASPAAEKTATWLSAGNGVKAIAR